MYEHVELKMMKKYPYNIFSFVCVCNKRRSQFFLGRRLGRLSDNLQYLFTY